MSNTDRSSVITEEGTEEEFDCHKAVHLLHQADLRLCFRVCKIRGFFSY